MKMWQLLLTLFSIHNETGNVWTHLVASVLSLCVATSFASQYGIIPTWPGTIYMMSLFILFTFSWWAHLTWPLGEKYRNIVFKLDYIGIIIVTSAHFFPIANYLFLCESEAVKLAYVSIVCFLGMCLVPLTMCDTFGEPAWRAFRSVCFSLYGASTIVPLVHGTMLYHDHPSWQPQLGLLMFGIDIVLNAIGAIVFAMRWPERRFPKTFDVLGNSHNIMHLCSIVALFSMAGSTYMWWYWRNDDNECVPVYRRVAFFDFTNVSLVLNDVTISPCFA